MYVLCLLWGCQGSKRWGLLEEEGLVYDGRVYVPALLF